MTTARMHLLVVIGTVLPTVAAAVPGARAQTGWSGTAEANANVFFGEAHARVIGGALGIGRADSSFQVRSDLTGAYADDRTEANRRRVTARASRLFGSVDLRPFARVSPFGFASTEASYQQRLARRNSVGAGAKLTFHRDDRNEASLSGALLWERSRSLAVDTLRSVRSTRARWSVRGRFLRQLSPNARFTHVTFYQPAVDRPQRYVIETTTTLAIDVLRRIALLATLKDRIDSEARARGAQSNHDGQLVFGVRATR